MGKPEERLDNMSSPNEEILATSQQKKTGPPNAPIPGTVVCFVPRIRGARVVETVSVARAVQKLANQRGKADPKFTLQEYFNGKTMVKIYYDWDAKYDRVLEGDERALEEAQQLQKFQEVIGKLHPGAKVEYAQRHGIVVDKEGNKKYKASYRAFIQEFCCESSKIAIHVRRVLELAPNENHPNLDLSVYKDKEQLLGVVFGCKDIDDDNFKRWLTPCDPKASPEAFLVQAFDVKEVKELVIESDVQNLFANQPKGKGKGKGKGPKTVRINSQPPQPAQAEQPAPADHSQQMIENNTLLGTYDAEDKGEQLDDFWKAVFAAFINKVRPTISVNDVSKVTAYNQRLYVELSLKKCVYREEPHGSNNTFLHLYEKKMVFGCQDEDCKKEKKKEQYYGKGVNLPYVFPITNISVGNITFDEVFSADPVFDELLKQGLLAGTPLVLMDVARHVLRDEIICRKRTDWYVFKGHSWQPLNGPPSVRLARRLIKEFKAIERHYTGLPIQNERVKHLGKQAGRVITMLEGDHLRDQIMHAWAEEDEAEGVPEFDSNPYLFACRNGVIDLKSGNFRPGRPDDYCSKGSKINYFDEANPPDPEKRAQFLGYMRQIYPIKEEMEGVQKIVGYAMLGVRPHKIFIVLTDTRDGYNGKSTLVKLFRFSFGDYYKKGLNKHLAPDKGASRESHSSNTAEYEGIRVPCWEEFAKDFQMDWSYIKDLCGGNSQSGGRRAHEKGATMFLYQGLMFMAMNLSALVDFEQADKPSMGRCETIPHRAKFYPATDIHDYEEDIKNNIPYTYMADPNIDEKLEELAPYFLEWCLEGLKVYQSEKDLILPASFREFKNETLDLNPVDTFADFVRNCIVTGESKDYIFQAEAYKKYIAYCKLKTKPGMSSKGFGVKYKAEMTKRFGKIQKIGEVGNGKWKQKHDHADFVALGLTFKEAE